MTSLTATIKEAVEIEVAAKKVEMLMTTAEAAISKMTSVDGEWAYGYFGEAMTAIRHDNLGIALEELDRTISMLNVGNGGGRWTKNRVEALLQTKKLRNALTDYFGLTFN